MDIYKTHIQKWKGLSKIPVQRNGTVVIPKIYFEHSTTEASKNLTVALISS